ncbi:MAG: thioredoxin family protein [Actinomycetota bacterium]
MEVILLTQDACLFCDQAKVLLGELASEYPISVREIELASEEGQLLAEEGSVLFPPGIFFEGKAICYGRPSVRRLRRELDKWMSGERHA